MTDELKPCPFCGSEEIEPDYSVSAQFGLVCNSCGASGPPDSKQDPDEAIAAWNQRTPPKVKALEWFKRRSWTEEIPRIKAVTTSDEYFVSYDERADGKTRWDLFIRGEWHGFATEDEAKSAAQADYERRVMACLEGYDFAKNKAPA